MKNNIVALVAGVIFALGLGVGGMTQPQKVTAFLDFGGNWDGSLMFVMGTAVMVYAIAYRLALRRQAPLFASRFWLPTRRELDGKLVTGAAMFGLGWGIAGYCPGPAIASLASGAAKPLGFVIAMASGMLAMSALQLALERRRTRNLGATTTAAAGGAETASA